MDPASDDERVVAREGQRCLDRPGGIPSTAPCESSSAASTAADGAFRVAVVRRCREERAGCGCVTRRDEVTLAPAAVAALALRRVPRGTPSSPDGVAAHVQRHRADER